MLLHVPLGSQGHLHVTRSWQGNLAVNWKVAAKGMYICWVQVVAMFALTDSTWRLEGFSLHILDKNKTKEQESLRKSLLVINLTGIKIDANPGFA